MIEYRVVTDDGKAANTKRYGDRSTAQDEADNTYGPYGKVNAHVEHRHVTSWERTPHERSTVIVDGRRVIPR